MQDSFARARTRPMQLYTIFCIKATKTFESIVLRIRPKIMKLEMLSGYHSMDIYWPIKVSRGSCFCLVRRKLFSFSL